MANLLKKRFTKTQIADMATTIANSMFDETIEALNQERIQICDQIYQEFYDEKTAKLIWSLPKNFLPTAQSVNAYLVNKNGDTQEVLQTRFNTKDSYSYRYDRKYKSTNSSTSIDLGFSNEMRLTYADKNHGAFKIRADSALVKALLECSEKIVDTRVERAETIEQMEGVLGKFGSFFSLYEHWPAVREILRKHEPVERPTKALPPATLFEDFNKKLGIPKSKVMTVTA